MKTNKLILGGALITSVVATGTLVSFSLFSSPALRRLGDQEYIERMQTINRDIQNPWFLGSFIGAAVLIPLAAYLYRNPGTSRQFRFLIASSLLYIIGAFGITSAVNVPMNDALDKVSTSNQSAAQLAEIRQGYETPWTKWHIVRTAAAVVATAAVVGAVFSRNSGGQK